MRDYLRFMGLMKKELYGVFFGVFMSFIASLSSVALYLHSFGLNSPFSLGAYPIALRRALLHP